MNNLTREQIESVLGQDIDWHNNHPGVSGEPRDWELGFVAGLNHARSLLRSCMATTEDWHMEAQS